MNLVRAAQKGDRGALEDLFRRYLPRIRKIVALRTGNKLKTLYEEDDLVQQALLRVFKSLRQYEERSESSFRSWVSRCVEHELIDLRRRAEAGKRTQEGRATVARDSLALIQDSRQGTPSEFARAGELEEKIEGALLSLPAHYREIIVLHHLCGMSHREIAEELGFGREGNARVALSRALHRLRQAMHS